METSEDSKYFPELKVTVEDDEEFSADELTVNLMEDGELLDELEEDSKLHDSKPQNTTVKDVKVVRSWMNTLQDKKIYKNRDCFVAGIDFSSEAAIKKLEDRAARFGLKEEEKSQITSEIAELYKSLNIDPNDLDTNKNIRLDALHMRGVDEMTTADIFAYFNEFSASSIEWINDSSCNICWMDNSTAIRALIAMSKPLQVTNEDVEQVAKNISDTMSSDDESADAEMEIVPAETSTSLKSIELKNTDSSKVKHCSHLLVGIPVPPCGVWRLGAPHVKAKTLLLRFATKDDKKIPGAEKRSQFYQKYGNPNYGGMKGIITSSKKRKIQAAKNRQTVEKYNSSSTDEDSSAYVNKSHSSKPKIPRMKMYADEEEVKVKTRGFKGSMNSVHSRLGQKYSQDELNQLGPQFSSGSEDEEEYNDVPIKCTISNKYQVWNDLARSMAEEDDVYNSQKSTGKYRNAKSFVGNRNEPYSRSFRSEISSNSKREPDLRHKLEKNKDSFQKYKSPLLRD